jgi:endonuclease/exonuclease/phosphatase family metal-dependent hydrolase
MLRRSFLVSLAAFMVVLLGACSKPSLKPPPEGHLRIVSWNLQWFPGHVPESTPDQQKEHMTAAKEALRKLTPDVFLGQEIRDWSAMSELVSVSPGLKVQVASVFGDRPQNQTVASRLDADSAWSESWKYGPANPPRGYSFAALRLPEGRYLLCYSLHLKSNLGELRSNIAMRHESSRQLLQHVAQMLAIYGKRGPCGVVVAGDMNTSLDDPKFDPDASVRALMAAGFYWTHEGVPFAKRTTIPADENFPDNCFDHILTLGLGKPVASVTAFPKISDHNPVIVDIDLARADFEPKLDVAAGESALKNAPPVPGPKLVDGVLKATDDDAIRAVTGQVATVQGHVSRVGATDTGSITFINFQGNDRGKFVAIIRKDQLAAVAGPFGGDLQSLSGKMVEIRGTIVMFRNAPQIEIRQPDQLKIVAQ